MHSLHSLDVTTNLISARLSSLPKVFTSPHHRRRLESFHLAKHPFSVVQRIHGHNIGYLTGKHTEPKATGFFGVRNLWSKQHPGYRHDPHQIMTKQSHVPSSTCEAHSWTSIQATAHNLRTSTFTVNTLSHKPTSHSQIHFFRIHFNIIPHYTWVSKGVSHTSSFLAVNFISTSLIHATCLSIPSPFAFSL